MDDADVVEAIEANAAELLMVMGAAGGGRQRDSGAVRWTIGGSPLDYHNAVVAADLSPRTADQAIAESLQLMKEHGVPGSWHVGPTMRPADLGTRLLTAGFTHGGSEPGMAVELADLMTPPSTGLEPVATTTVFLAAGVAGVYFVMTVPEARRRGIGAAITHTALCEARDSGIAYGVLGSSSAGRSVYAGLGFREYCTIELYQWSAN